MADTQNQLNLFSDKFLKRDGDVQNRTIKERHLGFKIYASGYIYASGIWDADGDTGMEIEQTPDDDTIRFTTAGTEFLHFTPIQNIVPVSSGVVDIGTQALPLSDGYFDNLESAGNFYAKTLYGDGGNLTGISTVTDFLSLADTPVAYSSYSASGIRVNTGETGLEFYDITAATTGNVYFKNSYSSNTIFQVNHNLGQNPLINIYNTSTGEVLIPRIIDHIDVNRVDITLSVAAAITVLAVSAGTATNIHSTLSNLTWSTAGHTIDADILPTASGNHAVGASGVPFASGSFDDLMMYETCVTPYEVANKAYVDNTSTGGRHQIVRGFEIADTADDDLTVTIQAGTLSHNTTEVNKTSNTVLTFATSADWWDGAVDSYAGGAGWCHIGVDSSGNVKLLGDNTADKADSDGNTDGTKLYWYDNTNYWRVIGAVYIDTDDKIHVNCVITQNGSYVFGRDWVQITAVTSANAWSAAVSAAAVMPPISTMGYFCLQFNDAAGNLNCIGIKANGTTKTNPANNTATAEVGGVYYASNMAWCPTDGSQQISHYDAPGAGAMNTHISVIGYKLDIR